MQSKANHTGIELDLQKTTLFEFQGFDIIGMQDCYKTIKNLLYRIKRYGN